MRLNQVLQHNPATTAPYLQVSICQDQSAYLVFIISAKHINQVFVFGQCALADVAEHCCGLQHLVYVCLPADLQ